MIALEYHYRLWRLRSARRKMARFYGKKYQHATQNKEPCKVLQDIDSERQYEYVSIDDDISLLVSRRLLSLAEDLLVPTPPFDANGEAWERSDVSNKYRLSRAASADLRAAIRKEQRERSELFFRWMSGLTGLVGAAIGLVALLLKLR